MLQDEATSWRPFNPAPEERQAREGDEAYASVVLFFCSRAVPTRPAQRDEWWNARISLIPNAGPLLVARSVRHGGRMSTLTLLRRRVPSTLLTRADEAIELLLLLLTAAFGTL